MRGLLAIYVLAAACHPSSPAVPCPAATSVKDGSMSNPVIDQEARQAVLLAVEYLPKLSINPDEYRVIFVQNILFGEKASAERWRVGFKRRALFPAEPNGLIGKGGEVFVEVDVSTKTVLQSTAGE